MKPASAKNKESTSGTKKRPRPLTGIALSRHLKAYARHLGFDVARVTHPAAIPEAPQRLRAWVEAGAHGDMAWMADRAIQRADPKALWSEVRSILIVGMNYAPDVSPLTWLHHKGRGAISAYALNQDYHDVMKARLKDLARHLVARAGGDVKVFVDTAPVMEKPLAQAAGLGWQGKHTVLVTRSHGNWLFLGALFTTLKLPFDRAEHDHCGRCTRCLDICPTKAFPAPYQLDARRCLAYLTVEHKGHIAAQWRAPMSNRIYGCDDCLAVCPWNKFAQQAREIRLLPRQDLILPELKPYLAFDDTLFRSHFKGSPIKRIGRARFLRNVLIALGNKPDETSLPAIEALIMDEDPRIRAMAIWAWARYVPEATFQERAQRALSEEADPDVRREWQAPWRTHDEDVS